MSRDGGNGLRGFEEKTAEIDGAWIRYFVAGDGPSVVLVHGLGGSALNWTCVAPALARRGRVLVLDLPGHGASEPLPRVPNLNPFADGVVELAAREGLTPAAFAGHSLGGLVALRAALRAPDAVSGLVLAAAAGISSMRRNARYALEVLALVKPGARLARHRRRIARSPLLRAAVFGYWGAADPAALPAAAVEGFLVGHELHADTSSAARALVLDDVRSELGAISCPALVLWGGRDRQLPVADGIELARRLRAPLRVVPGCGHLLIGERPDACVDAICSVIRRGSAPR